MNDELKKYPFKISHLKDKIFELHPHWTRRHDYFPFWTLGRASYKDFHMPQYYELAEKTNEILLDAFPDFYRDQLEFFEHLLKAPIKYKEGISLPGFHIFGSHPEFQKPLARPHVDIPFDNFDWGRRVNMNEIFTHVIPVVLPKAGAGMRVWWDYGVNDIAVLGAERCIKLIEKEPFEIIEHEVDQMLFHSGKFFHQIEPYRTLDPNDWRITLQSHAIKKDGVWNLYW